MTEPSNLPTEKSNLVVKAEELLIHQMDRCSRSLEEAISKNVEMLLAAAYALQVARGDDNITPPNVNTEIKAQSVRAIGLGYLQA